MQCGCSCDIGIYALRIRNKSSSILLFVANEKMPEDSLTGKHSVGLRAETEDGGLTPPPRIQTNEPSKEKQNV